MKLGAFSEFAHSPDAATVHSHQLLCDDEAQPGAVDLLNRVLREALVALEEPREVFRRDADALILHRHMHVAGIERGRDEDLATVWRILDRIAHQVGDPGNLRASTATALLPKQVHPPRSRKLATPVRQRARAAALTSFKRPVFTS